MSNQQEPVKRPKTKRFMAHIYFDRETGEQLDEPDDQICVFADLHDRDIKTLRKGLEFQVERTCDAGELNDVLREERDAALASLAAADEELAKQAETIERLRGAIRWVADAIDEELPGTAGYLRDAALEDAHE